MTIRERRMKRCTWSVAFAILGISIAGVYYWTLRYNVDFDDLSIRIQSALQAGNVDSARDLLEDLHRHDPGNAEVIELLTELALKSGDSQAAIRWLRLVPANEPERAAAARQQAAQLSMQIGQASLTETLALEAIRLNPHLPAPRRLLLRFYAVLFQHRKLHVQSARLAEQGQLTATGLILRCVAHRASWDDDEHVAWIEQCLKNDPTNPVLRSALARYYLMVDRTKEAASILKNTAKPPPDHWRVSLAYAEQAIDAGSYELAAEIISRLPDTANGESRVWLAKGTVWREIGEIEISQVAFENAALLDPYDPTPTYALSRFSSSNGDTDEAARLFERSQRQKTLMFQLGRLMKAAGATSENSLQAAADTFASLGQDAEAAILVRSSTASDRLASPSSGSSMAVIELTNLATVQVRSSSPIGKPMEPRSKFNQPIVSFHDVAGRIGLKFEYDTGRSPFRWLMETLGGGVAVLDFDRDGWSDLYFTQAGSLPRCTANAADHLFRNFDGESTQNVSSAAQLNDEDYGQGCAVGDYDNDGFPDLVVCNYGGPRFLKNQGDGTFVDITAASGIESAAWNTNAAFGDVDQDGDLDLYVVNYVTAEFENLKPCKDGEKYTACHPFEYESVQDRMWENVGNGAFAERTEEWGFAVRGGKGLGVMIADFEGVGRDGIFVGNDTTANLLFQKVSGSVTKFQEIGARSGVAVNGGGMTEACMGIALGDVDQDGWFDMFVTNFQGETNTLYHALGNAEFTDGTTRAGLADSSRNRLGFGCQFLDIDGNGALDLFVANGHLHEEAQRPQLYYNQGKGRFREISTAAGSYFAQPRLGRSVARLDWNRDLQTDLVVTYQEGNVSLLENNSKPGHAIGVRLIGRSSNRDAAGTRIKATIANKSQYHHYVTRCGGYFAANSPDILIGCGESTRAQLEVTWPTGEIQTWQNVAVGKSYFLLEASNELLTHGK
jgi:tetratricopeptide (TPR) repeat protein